MKDTTMKAQRNIMEVEYDETCPSWETGMPNYKRKHKWVEVKGSRKPHPSKGKAFFTCLEVCKKCGEIVSGEGAGLF